MTSQDRRYQDPRYQRDDDYRREHWRDERDDDNRRYQGSDRDYREASSGYGRGREDYPQREGGRSQDEHGRRNDFSGYGSGGYRGRFEEGYFGDHGEQWDLGRRDRYQGGDRSREGDFYRSYGSSARGQRGELDDQGRWSRGSYAGQQGSLGDRAAREASPWFGDDDAWPRRRQDLGRGERAGYQGIGPKNYRRSDERIREDVSDRLTDDPYVNAAEIEVSVSDGEVTLGGAIESRDQRRLAEAIAEAVSGVSHVQNNLRVKSQPQSAGYSSSQHLGQNLGQNLGQAAGQGSSQGQASAQGAGASSQPGVSRVGSHG